MTQKKTTFTEVAQEAATNALREVQATQHTIEECAYTDASTRAIFTLGALTGMLKGLTGVGEFATHTSCFDATTTEALKHLLETINQE